MAQPAEPDPDLAAFIEHHTEEIAELIHSTIRLPYGGADRGFLRLADCRSRPLRGSSSPGR